MMTINQNKFENYLPSDLRSVLVSITLEWESRYGVAPMITSTLSEYDAALLVGMKAEVFGAQNQTRTAVTKRA